MKRIITYSLLVQLLFFLISLLLLKVLLPNFNQEIYSFFFYFSIGYSIINFLFIFFILKLTIRKLSSSKVLLLLFFVSVSILNIYTFFLSKKILFLEIFKLNAESGKVALSLHLSLLITIMVGFLFVHRISILRGHVKANNRT